MTNGDAAPAVSAGGGKATHLRICGLAGQLCTVAAELGWSVQDVKRAVEAAAGVPRRAQRLLLGTGELRDAQRVDSLPTAGGALDLTLLKRSEDQVKWLDRIRDSWTAIVEAPLKIRSDREIVFAAVQQQGSVLRYASEDLRADRAVVLAAVANAGVALGWASESARADREVVAAALEQNGAALEFASYELRSDCELVLKAAIRNASALQFASEELRADRAFGLALVERDGKALKYLSEELRGDREVVLVAGKQNRKAYLFASEELQEDDDLQAALGFA